MKLGLDIGSTTIKCVVLDDENKLIYSTYERHYSRITEKIAEILALVRTRIDGVENASVALSGSAGMGVAESVGVDFIQEVYATRVAANTFIPGTDVIIELGGEDAKILFLTNGLEVRMNGTCAGGTGAFIDQMATLLNVKLEDMDELAKQHEKTYTIASRCGVFAKTDIQPLLNQGARKSDIAESIFNAVVSQTVAGLAQGREIEGQIVYLGGPLTFMSELRNCFDRTLGTKGICPENSLYYVACGAALCAEKTIDFDEVIEKVKNYRGSGNFAFNQPLFKNEEEYKKFCDRHAKADVKQKELKGYTGKAYIGMDAGSTTVKGVVLNDDGELLYSKYLPSKGNPVEIMKQFLDEVYEINPEINVVSSAVTGYGEDIVKNAFAVDYGIVETIAHFTAAKYFMPDVEFIIDIGGQDIKCFKIKNRAIDGIMLNEACSSGCGSFIQTFAKAMGMEIDEFSKLGLFSKKPVELGSRCTVFMNSSVKQAQKEGASVEDISAGLSMSIVKNAIYKVIRAKTPDELGQNILVQGGTFLNDAVLRSFEKETGKNVVRPGIAGLMGAFGAALYAKENVTGASTVITEAELKNFSYVSKSRMCGGCTSNCNVNVIRFSDGRKFISGNKCEKGAGLKPHSDELDIYHFKYERLLASVTGEGSKKRGRVGIPLGLGFYEQLPLWAGFFETCGFEVVLSEKSSRDLYFKGQHTVASDTACYPAKLIHGHIESLLDKNVDFIFYPCESYNLDEYDSTNHYNCPVVAYYPELLKANNERLNGENFVMPYIDPNMRKSTVKTLKSALKKYKLSKALVSRGLDEGFKRLAAYYTAIEEKGSEIIYKAQREGKALIVLAGRPYHIDPEINHGIGKLLTSLDMAVLSEDSVFQRGDLVKVNVLNQWTYHARLYRAAEYVTKHDDINLVQLVSFGCGIDAITTDEVRSILESRGKLYTQIKIDEINNLGVVKIRLRSMLAAIEEQKRNQNQ